MYERAAPKLITRTVTDDVRRMVESGFGGWLKPWRKPSAAK
jgi:hypothetical protein